MAPAIALVFGVSLYPGFVGFTESLYKTEYLRRVRFVGLTNYAAFFTDPRAWANVTNSLTYAAGSLAIVLPLGLVVAALLDQRFRFRGVLRAILILPWVVSQTITAMLWSWLLNPQFGPVPYALSVFVRGPLDVLGNSATAMLGLVLMNVWESYPYVAILALAALQAIPPEVLEAADVDGATPWQRYVWIKLPLIGHALLIATITLSLLYLNMVTLIFVSTGGGPLGATEVLSLRVFQEAFSFWNIGTASASAMIIFVLNLLFSICYIRVIRGDRDRAALARGKAA